MPLLRRTLVALVVAVPASLPAQTIRGIAVDAASGSPVGGSIIALVSEAGAQVASTLSNESGRFLLRAPAPGTYMLRALRIGIRSTTSPPLTVADGQTYDYSFAVRADPIMLDVVRVIARGKSCDVRPQETQAAGALWSEARKALTATSITQRDRAFAVNLRRYERQLDPGSMRVLRERSWENSGMTENPFVGLPAEQLASDGYVRKSAAGITYYAPDAQALLSDSFLDVHCLRALPEEKDTKGLVGVAFEPVKKRDVPDVSGVLWLDRETAELRFMEYRYTGLSRTISTDRLGGRVDFRRLRTGAWIVQRWAIRVPIVAVTDQDGSYVPGQTRKREVLRAIQEEGGEVMSIGASAALVASGSLAGTVFDSTQGVPLVGARVFLSGTSHWVLTDSLGHFTLTIPPGVYGVSFVHPRLDSLHWVAPGRDVTVVKDVPVELALVVPASVAPPTPVVAVNAAAAAEAAPPRLPVARFELIDAEGTPVVLGVVRDLAGVAIPSAQVAVDGTAGPRTRTGDDGSFRLAGVTPGGHRLSVQRIGFRTNALAIEVAAAKSTRVFIELEAVPAPLPQRRVVASRDRNGFEQRKKMGSGYFLTREEIEARHAPRFSEILRTVPGVRLVPTAGTLGADMRIEMGRSGLERRIRQRAPVAPGTAPAPTPGSPGGDGVDARGQALANNQPTGESACPVEYWVDGSRFVPTGGSIDNDIRPETIEAIEVYQGSLAPSQFRSFQHSCGVIVVWTKNGPAREK